MRDYRRLFVPGGTYFFTVVTADRKPWLAEPAARDILAEAMRSVRATRGFVTNAIVVLPDHLHCIWTLPPDDADHARRWKGIKHRCTSRLRQNGVVNGNVWQRNYWEHLVRDEDDYRRHLDYIHYNPVKHGLCGCPADWPASSFRRYVAEGLYPLDWGGPVEEIELPE